MNKWYELLKNTEVEGTLNIMSLYDIQKIEAESNISLPEEYKIFCQIFGSGVFGNEITVFCPPKFEESTIIFARLSRYLENLKQLPNFPSDKAKIITNILNNGLVFGTSSVGDTFFWDLTSDLSSNSNYDIYMTEMDSFESENGRIELVGKNFYTFICNVGLKNIITGFWASKYGYPDERFQSKFIPFYSNELVFDIEVKSLIAYYSPDFIDWLLGSYQNFVWKSPMEIFGNTQQLNSIILETDSTVLQIQVRTRPDSTIPPQFYNDRLCLNSKFPNKQIRQVIIYLKYSNLPIVHQTSYETSAIEEDFEVIRLWEQPTEIFMGKGGLLPLAVLSNTTDRENTLRQVAELITNLEESIKWTITSFIVILARLVIDNNVIDRILPEE